MSSKNIFEVLQSIAEDSEFNERFLAILREYGYEGTLEEAEETLKKQTQVVLNNLTTEDLQNVAGGRFLMNGKLKKALAVGGASLMAGGVVLPHGSALTEKSALTKESILTDKSAIAKKKAKNFVKAASDYAEENLVHTTVTVNLGLATMLLMANKFLGGKSVSNLPFKDPLLAFLHEKDLSKDKLVYHFVDKLSIEETYVDTGEPINNEHTVKLSIENITNIQNENHNKQAENVKTFTGLTLLLTLIKMMDDNNTYVDNNTCLTVTGAAILNHLAAYIIEKVNEAIQHDKQVNDAKLALNEQEKVLQKAISDKNEAKLTDDTYKENLSKYNDFVKLVNETINKIVNELRKLTGIEKQNDRKKFLNKYNVNDPQKNNSAMKAFIDIRNNCGLESDKNVTIEKLEEIAKTLGTELTKISELEENANISEYTGRIEKSVTDQFGDITKKNDDTAKKVTETENAYTKANEQYDKLNVELTKRTNEAKEKGSKILRIPGEKFKPGQKVADGETIPNPIL